MGSENIKSLRSSECPRMEGFIHEVLKQREKDISVTGLMIQEKANSLHSEYKHFRIRYVKISRQKLSSATELANSFKKLLPSAVETADLECG